MAYITNADIQTRIGSAAKLAQFTEESGSTPTTAKVDEIRNAAEGEMNGYLARRYAVPVDVSTYTELAGVLKSVALDIAVYRVHSLRPPVPDDVMQVRDKAVEWLKAVSKGEIVLPGESTPDSTAADEPAADYDFLRDDAGIEDML